MRRARASCRKTRQTRTAAPACSRTFADVVPDRVHPPRLPFRPEHRQGEREVILRLGGQPEVMQAVRVLDQRVVNEEAVIIPHEAAVQRRRAAASVIATRASARTTNFQIPICASGRFCAVRN